MTGILELQGPYSDIVLRSRNKRLAVVEHEPEQWSALENSALEQPREPLAVVTRLGSTETGIPIDVVCCWFELRPDRFVVSSIRIWKPLFEPIDIHSNCPR
jgi:hypothetical protein